MTLSHYWMLVDQLARMSLKADASRLYFGYLWWVLEPLLYVGVFYVVFDVILSSGRADFLIFLMCGKLMFSWFSKSVTQASTSIVTGRGLISKIDIPKSLFPVARIHEGLYRQIWVLLLLLVLLWMSGYGVNVAYLWLPAVLAVNYLLIVAAGVLAATLVCVAQDFAPMISLTMTFLLFVSGIFWDPRDLADPATTALILALNPIAFLVDAYRQILMYQQAPDPLHLALLGLVCGVCVVLLLALLRRYSRALALRALTR
ncbi:MAG: lipopolysaccharide transport system permease protein [Halieaceae bacterium]|jgi:lipopolysaccharide transport system permease protein